MPFTPVPIAHQLAPSQRALLFALTPPASVNQPPATRSPFGSTARAFTNGNDIPVIPVPSADQTPDTGSQVAMLFAATVPAKRKSPPTTNTGWLGPGPSGSQRVVARTPPFVPGRPRPGSHCVAHWAGPRPDVTPTTDRNSSKKERGEGRTLMQHPGIEGCGLAWLGRESRGLVCSRGTVHSLGGSRGNPHLRPAIRSFGAA